MVDRQQEKLQFIETYNDANELYDLEADPQELHNIIDEEPEVARAYHARLWQRMNEGKGLR